MIVFISFSQCNIQNFTVTKINGNCISNSSITVQVPCASSCTGWSVILTQSASVSQINNLPTNGGPVVFGGLMSGSYNVAITNGLTTVEYVNNPVVIASTYIPITLNCTFVSPSCPSNSPVYSANGSITITKNATGGVAPFTYTVVSSFGTQSVISNLNTATFGNIGAAENVSVSVEDACGNSVIQNVVSSVSLRNEYAVYGVDFKRAEVPNCNNMSMWIMLTDYGSADLPYFNPANNSISINSGAPLPLSYGTFQFSNALQGGLNLPSGTLLTPGDNFVINSSNGCFSYSKSGTVPPLSNSILDVLPVTTYDAQCQLSYSVKVKTNSIWTSNGLRYMQNHFSDINDIIIEQELPIGSGNYVPIPMVPVISNPLAVSIYVSSILYQAEFTLPNAGNYRITASDACHSVVKIFTTVPVNSNLDKLILSEQFGVLDGTTSVRIDPQFPGIYDYSWPISCSINRNPPAASVSFSSSNPGSLAGTYNFNLPFEKLLYYNPPYYGTSYYQGYTIGDLLPGPYKINLTDNCGNSRTVDITLHKAAQSNPTVEIIEGCQNSNTIIFNLNNDSDVFTYPIVSSWGPRISLIHNNLGVAGATVPGTFTYLVNGSHVYNNIPSGNYFIKIETKYSLNGIQCSAVTNTEGYKVYFVPVFVPIHNSFSVQNSSTVCDLSNPNSGVVVTSIVGSGAEYPLSFSLYSSLTPLVPIDTYIETNPTISSHIFTNVPIGNYFTEVSDGCISVNNNCEVGFASLNAVVNNDTIDCVLGDTLNFGVPTSEYLYSVTWTNSIGTVVGTGTNCSIFVDSTSTYFANMYLNPALGCPSSGAFVSMVSVVVSDTVLPILMCPSNLFAYSSDSACAALVTVPDIVVTDNCSLSTLTWAMNGATIGVSPSTGINQIGNYLFNLGVTNIVITAKDSSGNITSCSFSVTVSDNVVPTVVFPVAVNLSNSPGICGFTGVVLDPPATSDNCGVASVTNDAPATFPLGTTVVTWTVTDNAGNTATCTQNVLVTDTELPTIICPSTVTVNNTTGNCGATGVVLGVPTTSDNCGVASVTNNAPTTFPLGTTVVTWTVIDNAGNTATCTQNVLVTDSELPTITCPSTVNVNNTTGNCSATGVVLGTPTTADNCGVASVTNDAPATFPLGTTVVTWTVTDNAGNTTTCTQNVVVTDTELPTIMCPSSQMAFTSSSACNASIAVPNAVVTDNCLLSTLTWTMSGATTGSSAATGINQIGTQTFNSGLTTVTYTATDGSGNVSTCSFTVTVSDNVNPTITCPNNQTAFTSSSACNTSIAVPNAVVTDNCLLSTLTWTMSGATTGSSATTGINQIGTQTFNSEMTTVTYTATDGSGNVSTCSFTVTVSDNVNPTIICPATVSVSNTTGICGATGVVLGVPTTSDNCGVASVTNDALATFPIGTTVVTWTVTDNAGNTATCTQNVLVTDSELPTITCPSTVNVNNTTGNCSATGVVLGTPTTADNCGVASVTNDAPATFPLGTTVVTWTVTDNAGNTTTCTQNVVVTDTELPTIMCPSSQMAFTSSSACNASIAVPNAVVTDNCLLSTLTWTMSGATTGSSAATGINQIGTQTFNSGLTTVTYTATDGSGNVSTCSFTVTVSDNVNPTITCPNNQTAFTSSSACNASIAVPNAVVTDNCLLSTLTWTMSGSTTGSSAATGINQIGTQTFNSGLTTVTYTATDGSGNVSTCSFTVTVSDNVNPIIICTATVSVSNTTGICGATGVVLGVPTTSDNCGVASVTNDAPATFPIGTTVVTWTVTDNVGNTATCTQNVLVTDSELPTITCPSTVNVNNTTGNCSATGVVLGTPTTADNCGVASVTNDAPATFPLGTTVVTWTVTDNAGNTTTCTQNVVVTDTELPTITCPSTVNVDNTIGFCGATGVVLGTPTTADNCGVASVTNDAPATFPLGTTIVTWTVTDNAGNAATCTQNVVVTDTEDPKIICPINQTDTTLGVSCYSNFSLDDAIVTDNCSLITLTWIMSGATTGASSMSGMNQFGTQVVNSGLSTVMYTLTDASGNEASCSFVLTVITNPTAIDLGIDQVVCAGESLSLTSVLAGVPNSVIWSSTNGFFDSPTSVITNYTSYQSSGTDTLTLTIYDTLNNCSLITDQLVVQVNPLPQLNFTVEDREGCVPMVVTIINTSEPGLVSCHWDLGNGEIVDDCSTIITQYDQSGCYDISLTSSTSEGCVDSLTQQDFICVENVPIVDFTVSNTELTTIDTQVEFENTSEYATEYQWDFGDASANSTMENELHNYPEYEGVYTVTLIGSSDFGCSDTATQVIRIKEELLVYVPNSFTPDNNELNEQFKPVVSSGIDVSEYKFYIMNRWGESIFETYDVTEGWDGRDQRTGILCLDGSYTWVIEFKLKENGGRKRIVGNVNLIK